MKISYRPEIDGLRAFAVLAVIINHFNKGEATWLVRKTALAAQKQKRKPQLDTVL